MFPQIPGLDDLNSTDLETGAATLKSIDRFQITAEHATALDRCHLILDFLANQLKAVEILNPEKEN